MAQMESTRNKLIALLEKNEKDYISGQILSDQLNISRNAVWKHMKELEKDGYTIEAKRNKGYRITGYPDKISENTIKWGLNTDWIAHSVIHKESTPSTQILAHQVAREQAPHGTVIISDEQTEGKGRLNRKWHSEKNNGIWMSILLRPQIPPQHAPQLTLMTATVLAEVLSDHRIQPSIKWPNDLLLQEKKVAGILTEMQAEQDQIQYIIIGIGMNVNQSEDGLYKNLQEKATSLKIETGRTWSIRQLIQDILKKFENVYNYYIENGFAEIKKKWENYGFKIGEPIHIKMVKNEWEATFLGIGEDGALLTTSAEGMPTKVYSAEIDWFKGGNESC